jgi:comEA protein
MRAIAASERRIILILLFFLLAGTVLLIIDREHQVTNFNIRNFLDGYKHTSIVDTSRYVPDVRSNVFAKIERADKSDPYISNPKININNAALDELQMLPGVGPVLAGNIMEYRDSIGGFAALEDLIMVKGIGENKLLKLKDYIEF